MVITTPKLRYESPNNARLYEYYAGYSTSFVRDTFKLFGLNQGASVLDPWNGSGTTTSVSARVGYSALGYDLNPVMVLVAKARLLDVSVRESIDSLLSDILAKARTIFRQLPERFDPLEEWLYPESARFFRAIDIAIRKLLVDQDDYYQFYVPDVLNRTSSLAAFYYVATFRALRKVVQSFTSSNPTWIKTPSVQARSRPSKARIEELLRKEVVELKDSLNQRKISRFDSVYDPRIELGDSRNLPLVDESVDAILTSPPYCTRIDYVMATKPELALIGLGEHQRLKELRNRMVGTPTMCNGLSEKNSHWGPTCNSFLRAVRKHHSKASSTYYTKYFVQYFDSMHKSLKELHRVAKPDAMAGLVVQDSYYKDIHNDLPTILVETAENVGWKAINRLDFQISHTLAGINSGARKYRSTFTATEAVILLQKLSARRARKQ